MEALLVSGWRGLGGKGLRSMECRGRIVGRIVLGEVFSDLVLSIPLWKFSWMIAYPNIPLQKATAELSAPHIRPV